MAIRAFKAFVISGIIMFFFCAVSSSATEKKTITLRGTQDYEEAYRVLRIVNEERAKVGASPLTMDQDLLNAANQRSAEVKFYFNHTRPNGESCFTAYKGHGMLGENIAIGQADAEHVMGTWLSSSGHYANIVNANYKSIGIGCFYQNGYKAWVQVFSTSPPTPVAKSGKESVAVDMETLMDKLMPYISGLETIMVNKRNAYTLCLKNYGWAYAPSEIDPIDVDFNVSNASVATIDLEGMLSALAKGTTKVWASVKSDRSIFAEMDVAVLATDSSNSSQDLKTSSKGEETSNNTQKISLSKVKIKTIRTGKRRLKVRWSRISSASGYQIQYSLTSNFKSKTKNKILGEIGTKEIIGLITRKRYYVRIRAFQYESGKRIYGKWSGKVSVKVK